MENNHSFMNASKIFISIEALAKVLNNNVAANFSLRVLFYFNTLQTQAKACGYQNRTFARASILLILGFFVVLHGSAVAQTDYTAWSDSGIVYTAPSGDTYYPSVIFNTNGFGTGNPFYKMWYSDGSGAVYVVTSTNGTSWGSMATATGLGGDAHHVQVLYDALCFGASPCNASSVKYKIWYWDTNASVYSIDAISYAESNDGINWSNDQAVTQDATMQLVTGAGIGWNRGSYGPVFLFYQPGASNSGTEPWNYSYVMYYDGTDGSSEITGLAYSSNGLNWIAYSGNPVLNKGSGPTWDCDDSAYGTIYQATDGYHFWYSGGGGDNGLGSCASGAPVSQGIGLASSSDGKSWTKDSNNPIFHITDGVSYRNARVYTPSVVNDGSGFLKMYYSALALGSGQPKKIGLATLDITPPTTPTNVAATALSSSQVALSWNASTDNVGVAGYRIYNADTNGLIASTTQTSYTASGLNSSTTCRFYVIAYDAANNESPQSNSASSITYASGSTSGGSNITVNLGNGVGVTYDNVSGSCTTSLIVRTTPDHNPPTNFHFINGGYYDVSTNCTYSGNITVTFPYNESNVVGPESNLKLIHWESGAWRDVTLTVNTVNNTITGTVSSLSPFSIGYYLGSGSGYATGANTKMIAILALLAISAGLFILRKNKWIKV